MLFISPRWYKIFRDIWNNRPRTLLVVLAIAVGVFAFGGMFITREVLLENMNQGFMASNPATIAINLEPFDESLVHTARNLPNVDHVEVRASSQIQVWTGSKWMRLNLIAAPDFETMSINTINLEAGTLDLQRREIILERQSLPHFEGIDTGDTITIELPPDGMLRELTVVGVVHDFNATPASRSPVLTGYVSLDTLRQYGLSDQYTQLRIVTPSDLDTQAELEVAAEELADQLERRGYRVKNCELTVPGEHWAADFIEMIVLILLILGFLALALSGFLIVNTITAILARQKRQIGVMKSIGAQFGDLIGLYLMMAGAFGVLALGIALPLGVVLSHILTQTLADFVNVDIVSYDVSLWIYGLQALLAIITPLLVALFPVISGTRTTVREAISDYGIGAGTRKTFIDHLLMTIQGLPRPTLLSLRNTFRRKTRLMLTLGALTIAGAMFIAVLNNRLAILNQFSYIRAMYGFDVQLMLSEAQHNGRLEREALRIEGVERVEGWGFASATVIRPDDVIVEERGPSPIDAIRPRGGSRGTEIVGTEEGTSISIYAPPPDTEFIEPHIVEGRWLQPGDTKAIVLSTRVISGEPYIQVGDEVEIDFAGKTHWMEVVGIIDLIGQDFAYAPYDYITREIGAFGLSPIAVLGASRSDSDYQAMIERDVEEHFLQVGIGVNQSQTPARMIGAMIGQVNYFIGFMLFMASLLGIVGGLGLASTMSLNILERTREIGVMRAIGASNSTIRRLVLIEGLMIGLISFLFSIILSIPVSLILNTSIGQAFFERTLEFQIASTGIIIWLVIVSGLSTIASLLPANRAASVSVRQALAYE